MVKGYETLVDSETKVDVNTGMLAARAASVPDRVRGQQHRHRRDEGPAGPDYRRGALCCPDVDVGEIVRKLDQAEQHPESIDVGTDALGEADDAYDPTEFAEEDDEL